MLVNFIITLLYAISPPCASEDSTGFCHWDAQTMGNGQGISFLVIGENVHYPGESVDSDLAAQVQPESPGRDFTECIVQYGDTTYIICPDGYILES